MKEAPLAGNCTSNTLAVQLRALSPTGPSFPPQKDAHTKQALGPPQPWSLCLLPTPTYGTLA